MSKLKKLTKQQLFLPIFCMLLVLCVNIVYDVAQGRDFYDFFKIYIQNDMLNGRIVNILNRGSEVAMIFQNPMTCLNPVYTIGDQLMEAQRCHDKSISKQEAKKRAIEMLELVGINEPEKRLKQYPHELSGGMRQRVMIAIALACEPKLAPHCRRADYGPGCDHSGPDPGTDEGPAEKDRHGHHFHHPQPGRGG